MPFPPLPPFRPAPLLRSGHAQTLAGAFLPRGPRPDDAKTRRHVVSLPDGDAIVLHEDRPDGWRPGNRAAVLIHGLAGSFQSGYMQRAAVRLNASGVCAFRYDMRGCGAAYKLARHPAHSDRVDDLLAALSAIERLCPASPVVGFGFSLGGNLLLNTLARIGSTTTPLDLGVAVCPPIDLAGCSGFLKSKRWRLYDRHFITALLQAVADREKTFPDAQPVRLARKPTSLWEFDDAVTAPLSGFASAEAYYHGTSPSSRLAGISIPTLIVAAANDPLIPAKIFAPSLATRFVSLQVVDGGGHLGFISNGQGDADRRWLDWRVVDWATAAGQIARQPASI